jgi:NSS family neurotransmitter:Na+ symporter
LGERTFFDSVDFITANIMLPLGGLLTSIFVAWVLNSSQRQMEIDLNQDLMKWFLWVLKWVSPVAIMIVFATNMVTSDSVWLMVAGVLAAYGVYIFNTQRKST